MSISIDTSESETEREEIGNGTEDDEELDEEFRNRLDEVITSPRGSICWTGKDGVRGILRRFATNVAPDDNALAPDDNALPSTLKANFEGDGVTTGVDLAVRGGVVNPGKALRPA